MTYLVDMEPAAGIDLQDDEGTLRNGMTTATVEGGVYSIDPSTASVDANGTWKYTGATAVNPDELRVGMFAVTPQAVRANSDGRYVAHAQLQVLVSAINGAVNPGDLLVPIAGQNYLVKASAADLVAKRPIARAAKPTTDVVPRLTWVYFSGLAPFFGSTDTSPGITDETSDPLTDQGIVLVDYVDYTGGEFNFNSNNSFTGPVARVNRPRFQPGCMMEWDIQGIIARDNAVVQTLRLNPVVNGSVLAINNDHASGAIAIGYPGIIRINAEVYCIVQDGQQGGTMYYRLDTRIRLYQNDDTLLSDVSTAKRTTVSPAAGSINPTIDNDFAWKLSQTVADGTHTLWMTNFWCRMRAHRTGI